MRISKTPLSTVSILRSIAIIAIIAAAAGAAPAVAQGPDVATPPAAIATDGVPPIPAAVLARQKRYQDILHASFVTWSAGGGMIVATRHGNLSQLHAVAAPAADPVLLTRGDDPVTDAVSIAPGSIAFARAAGGDENWQIVKLDTASGKETLLTDGKSRNLLGPPSPDRTLLAITSTRRNGVDADVEILDPATGEITRVFEVAGETWSVDDWSPDGGRVVLRRYISRNETRARILDRATGALRDVPAEVEGLDAAARVYRDDFRFGPGGRTLLFLSDARGEFLEPARLDLESGKTEWLAPDLGHDVESLAISRDRRRAAFAVNAGGYSEVHVVDGLAGAPARRRLPIEGAIVSGMEFSPDGTRLGFTLGRPTEPSEAYSFDLDRDVLTRWTRSDTGGLAPSDFIQPALIRYRAADGLEVPAFVYVPRRTPAGASIPVVITIHGGPEGQYRPSFSWTRQYHARELGFAVIAPNVRGSTGYGKTYSMLDNGMRREDSVRDIGALLDWIRDTGAKDFRLDPRRVAVIGGSYGGYMVLASLIHFGERLRAGVDSVGISDFTTFLENTSGYRRHLRRVEYGDESDAEMRRFFERISPARRIGELRSALFLIHGKNDPRVPFSETVQVVERARATGKPVWTLYAANEGHGFRRKENTDYEQAAIEVFLQRFLAPVEE